MELRMLIYWNWGFWFNGTKDTDLFLFDGIEDFFFWSWGFWFDGTEGAYFFLNGGFRFDGV